MCGVILNRLHNTLLNTVGIVLKFDNFTVISAVFITIIVITLIALFVIISVIMSAICCICVKIYIFLCLFIATMTVSVLLHVSFLLKMIY